MSDSESSDEAAPDASRSARARWILGVVLLAGLGIGGYALAGPLQVLLGKLAGEELFEDRPTRYWVQQLRTGPEERAAAIERFRQGGPDGVPVLIALLAGEPGRGEPDLRWTSAEILGRMGSDAIGAEDALLAGLDDADPHVRAVCAAALPQVGVPAERAVPALLARLETDQRVQFVDAVGEYRGEAREAVGPLVQLVENAASDADLRRSAVWALGRIGPDAAAALPVLLRCLSDDRVSVREAAAGTIGMLGAPARDQGIPALIAALADAGPVVRCNALESLSDFGEASRTAVPEIKQLLEDPDERVQKTARKTLEAIAPEELPAEAETPVDNPEDQVSQITLSTARSICS
jgi:hypothetical protein